MHFEDVSIKCPKQFLRLLSLYVEGHAQKNSSLSFMPSVGFQPSKIWIITVEQVLKSFSGRNYSLRPPVFAFCDSLLFGLEESRELRALIGFGVIGIQTCKKLLPTTFLFAFLNCHYGFAKCFEILIFFSNIIPRRVSTCKILYF